MGDTSFILARLPQTLLAQARAILGEDAVVGPPELATADGDAHLEDEIHRRLWREIAALLPEESDFGLRSGSSLQRGAFHAIEYAIRMSDSLSDGVGRLLRFHRLFAGEAVLTSEVRRGHVEIRFGARYDGEPFRPLLIDRAFSILAALLIDATGGQARLDARFSRRAPSEQRPYLAIFRNVVWDAEHDALVLTAEQLELPMREADPKLCAILEDIVVDQLAEARVAATLSSRVLRAIGERLADAPSIADIAETMNTSARTLQDRLAEEDTSFRELLDQVRLVLATRYLAQPELSVTDIAFMLGYSDPTAFGRAFKRWTGRTPGGFRRGY